MPPYRLADVTVVVPAFNAANYIENTIASVLAQTVVPAELVVVDDGSTDDTAAVVQATFACHESHQSRVRLLSQKNSGVCVARNAGLAAAKGQAVMFVDADDVLLPWALEIIDAELGANPDAGMAFGSVIYIDENGDIAQRPVVRWDHDDSLSTWLNGNRVRCGSGALVRREVAQQVGGFETSMREAEGEALADWLFYLGVRQHGPTRYVPAPTVGYRQLQGSMSSDPAEMLEAQERMYQRVRGLYGIDDEDMASKAIIDHGAYHLSKTLFERRWRPALSILGQLGPRRALQAAPRLFRSRLSLFYWRRLITSVGSSVESVTGPVLGRKLARSVEAPPGAWAAGTYPLALNEYVDLMAPVVKDRYG